MITDPKADRLSASSQPLLEKGQSPGLPLRGENPPLPEYPSSPREGGCSSPEPRREGDSPPSWEGEQVEPQRTERPPRLQRRLFPSSSSSSQYSEEGWRPSTRGSETGTTESWEFKSTLEAPIARLESLDELESSQVIKSLLYV